MENMIFGLVGRKGSGKDTFFEAVEHMGYKRFAFGDALKELCAALGVPLEYFHDHFLKEDPIVLITNVDKEVATNMSVYGCPFERFKAKFEELKASHNYPGELADIDPVTVFNRLNAELVAREGAVYVHGKVKRTVKTLMGKPVSVSVFTTPRRIMQILGTDVVRQICDNFWVDRIPDGKVMVTDIRFPNEAEAVTNKGGKLIKVTDKNNQGDNDLHSSEMLVESIDTDYEIYNKKSGLIKFENDAIKMMKSIERVLPYVENN